MYPDFSYATVEDLLYYMGLESTTANGIDFAESCLLAASRGIDLDCGRFFYATDEEARLVDGKGRVSLVADLVSVSLIEVDGVAWAAGSEGYYLSPLTQALGWPYTAVVAAICKGVWPVGQANISITGVWGFEAVPENIRKACLARAAVEWNARGGKFDFSTKSVLQGDYRVERFAPDTSRGYELNQILMYRRMVLPDA